MPRTARLLVTTLFVMPMLTSAQSVQGPPADTYFSVAVSDNSHNHYGENLMFLDFAEQKPAESPHPRTVLSLRVAPGQLEMDGRSEDWSGMRFTRINSRVMNNYPLSEHYDATPTEISIASAFDDEFVYFVVKYEDANHDASVNRNRWLYRGGRWVMMPHVRPQPGTPAFAAVNRDEVLRGNEDEDQLFMMFPIVDGERNFRDGGLGCAGYCHANLVLSADPTKSQIGDGVASMHTNYPDDRADLWHWAATRTRPMNTLKDGFLDYGETSYNGRKSDPGSSPFEDNAASKPFRPLYVHKDEYRGGLYSRPGHATRALSKADLQPITPDMKFAEGVSLPFYIGVPGSGSRSDVETAARFDPSTYHWTVEMRRKRVTGDENDRQFVAGTDASAPTLPMVMPGDPDRGADLFVEYACASCHGENGEGVFEDDDWTYPRNQRVSGPAIRHATSLQRPKRLRHLAFDLSRYEEQPPRAMMPYIALEPQDAEDISAWLRTRHIPFGQ